MERHEPVGGLTPHLVIGGGRGAEAIAFYHRAFGAEEVMRHAAGDGRLLHAQLRINGAPLMLHDYFPEHHGNQPQPEPAGVVLHLSVDDADVWWNRALEAGAKVVMELADQFWGDRYGQLRDPYGHGWSIGAPAVAPQD